MLTKEDILIEFDGVCPFISLTGDVIGKERRITIAPIPGIVHHDKAQELTDILTQNIPTPEGYTVTTSETDIDTSRVLITINYESTVYQEAFRCLVTCETV